MEEDSENEATLGDGLLDQIDRLISMAETLRQENETLKAERLQWEFRSAELDGQNAKLRQRFWQIRQRVERVLTALDQHELMKQPLEHAHEISDGINLLDERTQEVIDDLAESMGETEEISDELDHLLQRPYDEQVEATEESQEGFSGTTG